MRNPEKHKYYDKLVLRKLMGIISPQEDATLQAWLKSSPRNREYFEQLKNQWQQNMDDSPEFDGPRRRRRRTKSGDARQPVRKRSTSFYVFEGMAFLLLVVATVLVFMGLKERPSIHHAGRTSRTLLLPDSTEVTLRPGSVLLVSSDYGTGNRSVEVEGKAFMDVRPDSTKAFTLVSEHSRISVSGTSLMVDFAKDGERDQVTVLTGEVKMSALRNPEKEVIIAAGKKGVFDHRAGTITVSVADTVNSLAWKKRQLVFNDTPLADVIEAAGDYFGIPFHVENGEMLKCPFTRSFTEPTMDEVMKAIREQLDVVVMREYGRIVIDGRNSCP